MPTSSGKTLREEETTSSIEWKILGIAVKKMVYLPYPPIL
jgi:hypothetical protein